MKIFLQCISMALLGVLSFASITVAAEKSEPTIFRIATASDPESLDPYMQLSGTMLAYSHLVFDPLVRWSKERTLVPRLAKSWEQINPTTLRVHLEKNVKFHSGNPFTAKDVVWTVNRLKKAPEFKGIFAKFGEPKAIDDYTVDIITTEPYGLVLNTISYIFVMDSKFYSGTDAKGLPKDAIEKLGYSFANDNVSGTGPFKLLEREHGSKLVLEANNEYWSNRGNVDLLISIPIRTEPTRVAAILKGDVDFIHPVPVQDYEQLDKNPEITLMTRTSTRLLILQMNAKRSPELANLKVRQAIIAATDTEAIVAKIMKGYTRTTQQQAPRNYAGYNPDLKPRYNLARAKELMKEAGYEKGFELSMIAPNNRYVNDEKIAQAFVFMMAKIGIKVQLKTMPKAQYWDPFLAQAADIQMIGWHPDTEDTANFSELLLVTKDPKTGMGQYNSGGYSNPKFDALIFAASREIDPAKRHALLKEAELIVYNEAIYIPLHWEPLAWASRPNVTNPEDAVHTLDFPYFGEIIMK